jgi:hypothetical protein
LGVGRFDVGSGVATPTPNGFEEHAGFEGLFDVGLIAESERPSPVVGAGEGGEGDGGGANASPARLGDELVAVTVGHADVAHDHVETFPREQTESKVGRARARDAGAVIEMPLPSQSVRRWTSNIQPASEASPPSTM